MDCNQFMDNILRGISLDSNRTLQEKDNYISFLLNNWPDHRIIELAQHLQVVTMEDLNMLRMNIKNYFIPINAPRVFEPTIRALRVHRMVFEPTMRARRVVTPIETDDEDDEEIHSIYERNIRRRLNDEFDANIYEPPIINLVNDYLPKDDCPICYEINVNTKLSCNHTFCLDCIVKYSSIPNNGCPICRCPISCISTL